MMCLEFKYLSWQFFLISIVDNDSIKEPEPDDCSYWDLNDEDWIFESEDYRIKFL